MVEAFERGGWRNETLAQQAVAVDADQLVEANTGPVKFAMAARGCAKRCKVADGLTRKGRRTRS